MPFYRFPILLAILLYGVPAYAAPVEIPSKQADEHTRVLAKIEELMSLGAPELALSFVRRSQPKMSTDNIDYWMRLEQRRYQLLHRLDMWQQVVDRTESNRGLYREFLIAYADRNWFTTQQIKALLQLKKYEQALNVIRHNLWRRDNHLDADVIALWRRLIIRSYLNLNAVDDAQRAMRRYRQDYGDLFGDDGDDIEWKLLQAQLLMRTGAPVEAVHVLESVDQPEAVALLLLARMQAKQLSDQAVDDKIQGLLDNPALDEKQRSVYWYVRLQLAVHRGDLAGRVQALEQLFYLQNTAYVHSVFTDAEKYISPDALWNAYERYGLQLANRYKLLRGDDVAWYSRASNMFESKPQQAKALLAVLAFGARQQEHRGLAMLHLTSLLEKREHGLDLVFRLFMQGSRVANIETVPVEVRYRLVDYALSKADLMMAARLMEKLQKPPEGQDRFEWGLRRARILILGGEYQEGVQVLLTQLGDTSAPETPQIDQYMQVVFDLQNVQQHAQALRAFEKLEQGELSPKLRREIAFWKAESYQKLENYEQAAFLFLKSAIPLDNTVDPWFHTASFRAAESLAQAGLVEDARRQYLRLLRVTANSARKAVIRQRLQQLRLQQHRAEDAEDA